MNDVLTAPPEEAPYDGPPPEDYADVPSPAPAAPPLERKDTRKPKGEKAVQQPDRLPPHSAEAEQGVIGCCLIDPQEALGLCVERISRDAAVFYDGRHRELYDLMVEMFDLREPVDIITIQERLKSTGRLDRVGGLTYLMALQETTPSSSNLAYYLDILLEHWAKRRLINACTYTIANIYEHRGTSEELLDDVEQSIYEVRNGESAGRGISNTKDLADALINDAQRAHETKIPPGVPTGFYDLDNKVIGLQPQQVILLGGSPSAGKTSLALNICNNLVFRQDRKVGIFSLETSAKKILFRMVCSEWRINGATIMAGFGNEDEYRKLTIGLAKVAKMKKEIQICDRGGMNLSQIGSFARRMRADGVELFVIDYLQLISSSEATATEKVTAISQGVKHLAKDLDAPVLAICSLNMEGMKGGAPQLGHLRQSGQLGYDADQAWLLHCKDPSTDVRAVDLDVAKSKDTDTGKISLEFFKYFYRFESASKVRPDDFNYSNP